MGLLAGVGDFGVGTSGRGDSDGVLLSCCLLMAFLTLLT